MRASAMLGVSVLVLLALSGCTDNNDQTGLMCPCEAPYTCVRNACALPTCFDGVQNGAETGVDCGGSCGACATCSDGLKNGTETGVDCGGSCPNACEAAPTCTDGLQNGTETGVDCGGVCTPCVSAPTCTDGVQNGTETGVDCGGSCPNACARCGDGMVSGEEECDGGEAPVTTCAYGEASCMVCDAQCKLVAGQVTGFCGDGVLQADQGEECEVGTELPETACHDASFAYGKPSCDANCKVSTDSCFNVLSVHAGSAHTCAITTGGKVRCWGNNEDGRLGLPPVEQPAIKPVEIQGIEGVEMLTPGARHTCALKGGQILCWGGNDYGELGNGTRDTTHTPQQVSNITTATQVMSGGGYSCAQLQSGELKCWGWNGQGSIGSGGPPERYFEAGDYDALIPRTVQDSSECVSLGVGHLSSYCIKASGEALAWGYNAYSSLGVITEAGVFAVNTPLPVEGITDAAQLVGGIFHSCVRHTNGTVSCWGRHDPLGSANGTDQNGKHVMPGVSSVTNLQAGFQHDCVLNSSGRVLCWGVNTSGQLGRGTIDAGSSTPAPVSGFTFSTLSTSPSGSHSCGLLRDGLLYCWGANNYGQLGDGSTIDRSSPVAVQF